MTGSNTNSHGPSDVKISSAHHRLVADRTRMSLLAWNDPGLETNSLPPLSQSRLKGGFDSLPKLAEPARLERVTTEQLVAGNCGTSVFCLSLSCSTMLQADSVPTYLFWRRVWPSRC